MLRRLFEELAAAGVEFRVVQAHGNVRDVLRAEGLEERVGFINRHQSLAEVVQEAEGSNSSVAAEAK
jgi:SulP family sulfate permease